MNLTWNRRNLSACHRKKSKVCSCGYAYAKFQALYDIDSYKDSHEPVE